MNSETIPTQASEKKVFLKEEKKQKLASDTVELERLNTEAENASEEMKKAETPQEKEAAIKKREIAIEKADKLNEKLAQLEEISGFNQEEILQVYESISREEAQKELETFSKESEEPLLASPDGIIKTAIKKFGQGSRKVLKITACVLVLTIGAGILPQGVEIAEAAEAAETYKPYKPIAPFDPSKEFPSDNLKKAEALVESEKAEPDAGQTERLEADESHLTKWSSDMTQRIKDKIEAVRTDLNANKVVNTLYREFISAHSFGMSHPEKHRWDYSADDIEIFCNNIKEMKKGLEELNNKFKLDNLAGFDYYKDRMRQLDEIEETIKALPPYSDKKVNQ